MHWLIIAALVLLGLSNLKGSGDSAPVASEEKDRYKELRDRAASGASWAADFLGALTRSGIPMFAAAPIAAALSRWAGIESGGDPNDLTTGAGFEERGLLQATHDELIKGGGTEDDWAAILKKDTPRARQTDIMIKYLKGFLPRVMELTGWSAANYDDLIWAAYVYHALPIVLKEMADQKMIVGDRFATSGAWRVSAIEGATPGYQASDKAISYGKPTHDPAGLYKRFGIAANVVADG